MAAQHNAKLNQVLIRLHRSLLQYAEECWPWVGSAQDSAEKLAIEKLAALRQTEVGQLVDLLALRGWAIDFGSYPTEYTDLHYVAVEYLLGELISDSDEVLAEAAPAAGSSGDVEATALLQKITTGEKEIAAKLRELKSQQTVSYLF